MNTLVLIGKTTVTTSYPLGTIQDFTNSTISSNFHSDGLGAVVAELYIFFYCLCQQCSNFTEGTEDNSVPIRFVADPATLEGDEHIPYCPAFLFSPSLSLLLPPQHLLHASSYSLLVHSQNQLKLWTCSMQSEVHHSNKDNSVVSTVFTMVLNHL